ncbi:metallophosphoesterase [Actinokineospora soli]
MLGGSLYVVSDVHGHHEELVSELQAAGLIDRSSRWAGGRDALWFLGDYVDRGPDGLAVIDLVMSLQVQAAAAGGHVGALLGNHEIQFLAADRFGTTPLPGWSDPKGAYGTWLRWGGLPADLDGLTDDHRAWLYGLPAVALVGDHLLLHSDTIGYLGLGASVDDVNAAVAEQLRSDAAVVWQTLAMRLSRRQEFRGSAGREAARDVLAALGGRAIVHGHSTIPEFFGGEGPVVYAGGLVTAVDGGSYNGGRVLVVRLG